MVYMVLYGLAARHKIKNWAWNSVWKSQQLLTVMFKTPFKINWNILLRRKQNIRDLTQQNNSRQYKQSLIKRIYGVHCPQMMHLGQLAHQLGP